MKTIILIILLSSAINCHAQAVKDTVSKKDKKEGKSSQIEKVETPKINFERPLINYYLHKGITEPGYYLEQKKPSFKETMDKNLMSDEDALNQNMNYLYSGIRNANEDKRSPFIKTVQNALGIAQMAVVSALAVREIIREIQNKPKK